MIFFELVDFVGLCGLELEECNKCINLLYLFRNVKLMVLFWSGWFGSCVLLIELKINWVFWLCFIMYRLSRRFCRWFGKDKEEKKDKYVLDYVIVLFDGSDFLFNLYVSFIRILI